MITGLLDHLWQSTLFAGGMGLLTLVFRRNGAGLRFWLWFAASVKFLLPFAALAMLGEYLSRLFPAALPRSLLAIQPAAERLSAPAEMLVTRHSQGTDLAPWLLAVWLQWAWRRCWACGWCAGLRLRAVIAASRDLKLPGAGADQGLAFAAGTGIGGHPAAGGAAARPADGAAVKGGTRRHPGARAGAPAPGRQCHRGDPHGCRGAVLVLPAGLADRGAADRGARTRLRRKRAGVRP